MSRPIATTVLAIAVLACEGSPVIPPSSNDTPSTPVVAPAHQPDPYRDYQQRTGYPHDPAQYDQLPGYQRCGTACGRAPTSGEQQLRHLCERGLIDPTRC